MIAIQIIFFIDKEKKKAIPETWIIDENAKTTEVSLKTMSLADLQTLSSNNWLNHDAIQFILDCTLRHFNKEEVPFLVFDSHVYGHVLNSLQKKLEENLNRFFFQTYFPTEEGNTRRKKDTMNFKNKKMLMLPRNIKNKHWTLYLFINPFQEKVDDQALIYIIEFDSNCPTSDDCGGSAKGEELEKLAKFVSKS